jgi:DNA polymerase I-like protein with 3'-5' exonuclease and polymerase domains
MSYADSHTQAFLDGTDLHLKIVALVLGIAPDAVSGAQRNNLGKPSNFGFIYGRRAEGWRIGISAASL